VAAVLYPVHHVYDFATCAVFCGKLFKRLTLTRSLCNVRNHYVVNGGMGLQLRHLRYFIAVAEEGSVMRAAQRLHVAQPSISRQIRDLEREVGCALFERLPRGVRTTAAGTAFLTEARSAVQNAARAVASARNAEELASAHLQIAAERMTYYPAFITTMVSRFRSKNRDCRVKICVMSEQQQKSALRENQISASLSWITSEDDGEFERMTLCDAEMQGVIIPAEHALADSEKVSLSDLAPLTRLVRPRRISSTVSLDLRRALAERGLQPSSTRAVQFDVDSVGMHVAAGDCYVLANEEIAKAYTSSNEAIVFRRFEEPPIPMRLVLSWRSNDSSPYLARLLSMAATVKADLVTA
jgi:DNA-binding transcriptional LysR family regulator